MVFHGGVQARLDERPLDAHQRADPLDVGSEQRDDADLRERALDVLLGVRLGEEVVLDRCPLRNAQQREDQEGREARPVLPRRAVEDDRQVGVVLEELEELENNALDLKIIDNYKNGNINYSNNTI